MGMRHKNPYGKIEYIDGPVPDCGCNVCQKLADKVQQRAERRSQRSSGGGGRQRGGTFNSTAFKTRKRTDDSGKTDVYFNGPGDGSKHGHVVECEDESGNKTYPYVRDVEGDVYNDEG